MQMTSIDNKYLGNYSKSLSVKQTKCILKSDVFKHPYALVSLLEELRIFGSYNQISEITKSYTSSHTINEFIQKILSRAENDYGYESIKRTTTYL